MVRAIAAFVVGFWLLDVANNMTQDLVGLCLLISLIMPHCRICAPLVGITTCLLPHLSLFKPYTKKLLPTHWKRQTKLLLIPRKRPKFLQTYLK
ncbi:uncharacterized protein LOC114320999 isoform X2 [Camellia sinensis]|uniref:uncharacterized protein LOC114320999 isoform X2 n=1 Tax=Camellia sinensis TaxID=4442 RepID=UPI0010367340|nr:uncharacterized protein LOC114320999 isoform X2 [Camellia sinensis]